MMTAEEKEETGAVEVEEDWPNLYEETCEMGVASMAVFFLADLRALARKGQLTDNDAEQVLHGLPLSAATIKTMWDRNEAAVSKIRSRDLYAEIEKAGMFSGKDDRHRSAITFHHVGDESAATECVYIIGTDSERKRITLSFRGSITVKDWEKNGKTLIATIPNPVADLAPNQPETIGVHLGYRDYLYGEQPSKPSSKKETTNEEDHERKPRKIDVILDQLRALHQQHPEYKLYVAGHSLGGALAVMAALETAAMFGGNPHPVTCVTLGNPKGGNHTFRSAMSLLEAKKKLRCIGIHNYLDVVPTIPPASSGFCHVGMIMDLFQREFEITYEGRPLETTVAWTRSVRNCTHCLRMIAACRSTRVILHDYREYFERLVAQKEELSKLYLNDQYDEVDFEADNK